MAGRGPLTQRGWALAPLGLLASCAVLVVGCGSSGGSTETSSTATSTTPTTGLSVTVDPAQAAPGDQIQAVVVNDSDKQYTYGAAYELERQVDGTWRKVELPPTPVPEIGYVAPPGKDGPPVIVDVPKDAQPGAWRVVISRDAPGGLLSGGFAVTSG